MQCAREQGCPWNTCDQVAVGGHLAALRWAQEHDCPWDKGTVMSSPLSTDTVGGGAVGAGARLSVG